MIYKLIAGYVVSHEFYIWGALKIGVSRTTFRHLTKTLIDRIGGFPEFGCVPPRHLATLRAFFGAGADIPVPLRQAPIDQLRAMFKGAMREQPSITDFWWKAIEALRGNEKVNRYLPDAWEILRVGGIGPLSVRRSISRNRPGLGYLRSL